MKNRATTFFLSLCSTSVVLVIPAKLNLSSLFTWANWCTVNSICMYCCYYYIYNYTSSPAQSHRFFFLCWFHCQWHTGGTDFCQEIFCPVGVSIVFNSNISKKNFFLKILIVNCIKMLFVYDFNNLYDHICVIENDFSIRKCPSNHDNI